MDEVESYISSFDKEVKNKLEELYKLLLSLAPRESMQTISYGIPTFKFKGKNLIHFGGAKSHVAIYPGAEPIAHFAKEIEGFKTSKGTIQFKLNEKLPKKLIEEIIKFRLEKLL